MVSAAAKAVHPGAAAEALVEFGWSWGAAKVAVFAGVATEAAVATAMALWPRVTAAQVSCVALFGAFALVAVLSLQTGRAAECGCLGALRRSTLGWTQILQLAIVVPAVIFVGRFAPAWSSQTGLGALFGVQIAASGLLFALLSPVWFGIRRDRVSLGAARVSARQLGWTAMPDHEAQAP
jgi:hypothetical protein